MPRLRVVRCAWETTAMKWFEKNRVQGGRVDRIRVVSHGCLWFYDILCNVVFFCLDLFGEVLFGVLGKQTFLKKKSWGEFSSSSIGRTLQFLFFRQVHGAGWRVQVTWSYRELRRISPSCQGLALILYTPENERLELKHGGLVQMIFPFKGMIFMFHYVSSGEYKESYSDWPV